MSIPDQIATCVHHTTLCCSAVCGRMVAGTIVSGGAAYGGTQQPLDIARGGQLDQDLKAIWLLLTGALVFFQQARATDNLCLLGIR